MLVFRAGVSALRLVRKSMPSPKSHTAKGRTSGALAKPVRPDEVLTALVGPGPLPRSEVIKKVWQYIRHHRLQDSQNRRNINADDKIRALFGGKSQATMFELTKFINQHLR
jgi:upstream activation factor subunit UAF30